ncbi:TetR family transcriptional regulator [Actinoplanes sp. NPDC051861]|uniref:TetR/AcrR family transcriptional regulator n=1 Tax=Actinoplanes sp. NPDC051861 TaxID=3155170 RepID=UPI00342B8485
MTDQPRRRNAAQTRQALLDVARARFARHGYAATTVRDIADEAGVNVALINRYFTSKEGLFEACLGMAVTDVDRATEQVEHRDIAEVMARRLAGASGDGRTHDALLLLVRSSGDARIDELRRSVLRAISRKLAGAAEPDEAALLRGQVVLATALGIVLLRNTIGVEPLASAGEQELREVFTDLIRAMVA